MKEYTFYVNNSGAISLSFLLNRSGIYARFDDVKYNHWYLHVSFTNLLNINISKHKFINPYKKILG